jgi:pyrroloquinoline quinone biosynthesis protein B
VILRLLGTAAGGGLPQWNCGCPNCRASRAPFSPVAPRTQASAAVSADGEQWFLLNVSPDVRAQIDAFPALHPRGLREHNALVRTLERRAGQTAWNPLRRGEVRPLVGAAGPSGLSIEVIAVPGTVPLHLKQLVEPSPEDNVAVILRDGHGRSLVYAPSVGGYSAELESHARSADVLVFDGTFFRDDELTALGLTTRTARDMAHWPLAGPEGSLGFLAEMPCAHKILTHVNNTNPVLRASAPERGDVSRAGVVVGHDGLEVRL